jgi:peptidoglycan/LPS O-acetylase OafA/YrhL
MRPSLSSIGEKLDRSRGLGRGFDFLRVTLALGVVVWHSFAVARDGFNLDRTPLFWIFGYALVFMFFVLSGFLITGSALRLQLKDFLINRMLRICPALTVEVILSAFVLGPLFTSLGIGQYFGSPETYHYLTNVLGSINYHLPGVFKNNPMDNVNISLWTVPYEFICYYGIMTWLVVFGLLKRPFVIIAAAIGVIAIGLLAVIAGFNPGGEPTFAGVYAIPSKILFFCFTDWGSRLFVAFLLGAAAYLLRYRIPYSPLLATLSVVICVVVAGLGPPAPWASPPVLNIILPLPLAYLMAFCGVSDLPALPVFRHGDYSYGTYLYAMPIQQMMVTLFPDVRSPAGQLCLSVPAIVLFAAVSWHLIERPILKTRGRLSFASRQRDVIAADAGAQTLNVAGPVILPIR